jgi:hypothetical protein
LASAKAWNSGVSFSPDLVKVSRPSAGSLKSGAVKRNSWAIVCNVETPISTAGLGREISVAMATSEHRS